jgi:hypothetical protein
MIKKKILEWTRNILYLGLSFNISLMAIFLVSCLLGPTGCQVVTDKPSAIVGIALPENEAFEKFENGQLTTRCTRPMLPPRYHVYQVRDGKLELQVVFKYPPQGK